MSWEQIKEHIDKTLLGAATLLVFFILQFLWFVTEAEDTVPIWVLYALVIFFYICCVVIYAVCRSRTVEIQYRLPHVRTINTSYDEMILILEKSDLFSYHMLVTAYQQDPSDGLEIPIAVGVVQTITQQGYPQIQLTQILKEDIVQSLVQPSASRKWKTVYVRPSVSLDYLERLERRSEHE